MLPWTPITDPRDPAVQFGGQRYEIDPDHDGGDTAAVAYADPAELTGPDGSRDGWRFWRDDSRVLCERE